MDPVAGVLSKIALAVVKKAVIAPKLSKLFHIVSSFELCADVAHCISTTSDCKELSVCGLQLISNHLPDFIIDRLVEVQIDRFTVKKTPGGIHVASQLTPAFDVTATDFPDFSATLDDLSRLYKPRQDHMSKTVIVNCAYCGERIGEISFVAGEQVLSHHCKVRKNYEHWLGIARQTRVIITSAGEMFTKQA